MNFEDFDKLYQKMTEEEMIIGRTKGMEYTDGSDRLDNFKRLGRDLGCSPKMILWIYLRKHIDSLDTYIRTQGQQPMSEPIQGRIKDARVYLALLRGLIEEDPIEKKGGPGLCATQV
jgi:hypothetical protein